MIALIESIASGGYGLARTPEGVIFIRGVIPGETVEIFKSHRRRGVLWADEFRVTESSPERTESACPYFPACGGCDFHHMTYEAELKYKLMVVRDTLRRISGAELPTVDAVSHADPLEYRNSVRLQGEAGHLGYFRKESNEVVEIDDCPIAAPAIRAALPRREQKMLRVDSSGQLVNETRTMRFLSRDYRVSPESFFQVNVSVAEMIARDLRDRLPRAHQLVDLFAGVGTFALALADLFPVVLGCEIAPSALDDFRFNARDLPSVTVLEWDAAKGLKTRVTPDDVLILDPPRTGLPPRLIAALSRARPKAFAYISCDAATFARDAKILMGGFRLSEPIRVYDMFPRTAHVELLGLFAPS